VIYFELEKFKVLPVQMKKNKSVSMRYHRDVDIRVDGERHAGITIKGDKILLVHRIKDGYEYYVFPGGHRRKEENGEETVIRETYEEAGIEVKNPVLAFDFRNYVKMTVDFYYLCTWKSGEEPRLIGEELDADPAIDLFDPMWMDVKEVENLNILPKFAKNWLEQYLEDKEK